ncbi:MAG TPA: hypothetical protein VGM39_04070 [Kofleriaceae bacterium]|jgi:hypothetical protein
MRSLLVLALVLVATTHEAWSGNSPAAVIGAFVANDPANDAVEAAAVDVAKELTIERATQAHVWQRDIRDDDVTPTMVPASSATPLDDVAQMQVHATVFSYSNRNWWLYANGMQVGWGSGNLSLSFSVARGEDIELHAECSDGKRCSRTIHVESSDAVAVYIDATSQDLVGQMASSLSLAYASELERNTAIVADGARVMAALVATNRPGGDVIAVMSEGSDFRLVYGDERGNPLRTLRTSRSDLLATVHRLVNGESEPSVGPWQSGKHRVVVEIRPHAPGVSDLRSSLDASPTKAVCRPGHCEFAAPAGALTMRFDEQRWGGPLRTTVKLDKDLLVTVRPGRRYWAKYTGMGLMGVGAGSLTFALVMGAIDKGVAKAGDAVRPTSGPESSSSMPHATNTEAIAFFGGVGTVAVGAFMYLVVHKKPKINVTPLGPGIAF